MKIGMLHVDVPPIGKGGVAYQVHLLACTLVARGHDVTVHVTHAPPPGLPYRCLQLPVPGRGRLNRQFGVGRAFAHADLSAYEVVHAHGDDWSLPRSVRRVRTFYGTALMEARWATTSSRRASQAVHFVLEALSSARATYGVAISRHTQRFVPLARWLVPCAVDTSVFFASQQRSSVPTILFVAGAMKGRKRGSLMLEAFGEVRARVPEARLHVVSREAVIAPGVIHHSSLSADELGALYRSCWVLCSTSSYEGFGVPYVEAMASGLPVVSTPNAGALEVLANGELGMLCEPPALPQCLTEMLSDSATRDLYAKKGLVAASRYSASTVAEAYERIYELAGSQ